MGFRGRLDSIQVLRGWAAFLVLLYHVALVENTRLDPLPDYPALTWLKFFGYGGVNLFFVISGFIMYWITAKKWYDPTYWRVFVGKRLWRIYPVLLVCFVLDIAVNAFIGNKMKCLLEGDPYQVVSMFLLLPGGGPLCLLPQAWSLYWEVYFYLVFSLIFLLRPAEAKYLAIGWLAVSFVLTFGGEEVLGKRAHHWGAYNLHFALGIAAAWLLARTSRFGLAAACLGFVWFGISSWLNSAGIGETHNLQHRLLQYGVGSFFLVYGFASMEKHGQLFNRWLVLLGDASYSLYLTHLFVLALIRQATAGFDHTFVPHTMWLTLMIGLPVAFAVAFHLTVEKPLLSGKFTLFRRPVPVT